MSGTSPDDALTDHREFYDEKEGAPHLSFFYWDISRFVREIWLSEWEYSRTEGSLRDGCMNEKKRLVASVPQASKYIERGIMSLS
jgi:hypothetical protein